jgi:ribulose-5-phosphate 4-epimerase/fuculose-1-phosphate aldolase
MVVTILGPIEASSEVLTHAAIYEHNKNIKSIFHIHSKKMWNFMIQNKHPHTAKEIAYGTLEMAKATQNCIGESDSGIFCMHGHLDGIVAFGKTLDETWDKINQVYELAN